MKFSLACKVDSKIEIPKEIKIEYDGKEYFFYPDGKNILEKIKIIVKVNHPEKFYSKIYYNPNSAVKHAIVVERDADLFDSLIKEFQEIESNLAFSGNVKRISWDNPEEEVICETSEEKQKVMVFSTHFIKSYPEKITVANEDTMKDLIFTKERYASLVTPKAFWREGKNSYNSFAYINAFFNFYFVIEGLHGGGKTKNDQIEEELKKSVKFREIINWAIDNLKKETKHFDTINGMLKYRQKSLNTESLIELIVKTRGELHHFVNNSNKLQGTPFNNRDFESITWILLGIANLCILYKIVEINRARNS